MDSIRSSPFPLEGERRLPQRVEGERRDCLDSCYVLPSNTSTHLMSVQVYELLDVDSQVSGLLDVISPGYNPVKDKWSDFAQYTMLIANAG